MENIINEIKKGNLCRCNDEKNANGLWDYAFQVVGKYQNELSMDSYEDLASQYYYDLWEMVDIMGINKCNTCII